METAGAASHSGPMKPGSGDASADIINRDPQARDQDGSAPAPSGPTPAFTASSATQSGKPSQPINSSSSTMSSMMHPASSTATYTTASSSTSSNAYHHPNAQHHQQQHQQYFPGPAFPPHGAFTHPAAPAAPAAAMMSGLYPPAAGEPSSTAAAMQHQQHMLDDEGSSPLPEAAPAPKTDPVELSLLASYLEVVRQTQGEAAAVEAMAASGLPANQAATAAASSFSSIHALVHQQQQQNSSAPTAAAGSLATTAAAADEQLQVNNLLGFIKQRKLTGIGQLAAASHGRRSSNGSVGSAASATGSSAGQGGGAAAAAAARKIWIQPSGPRRPGEGVENEEQGILSAEEVPSTGEVMMRITLLAAGFVIGPSGASVREIVRLSGADINSWTEAAGSHRGRRPARIFVIKGEPRCVAQAIYIVTAAVDRYKELCEGKYTGQSVPRAQNVLGVTFSYQPPPKSIVPYAASLKELYAPPHTVANSAKYATSPPGLFGTSRRGTAAAAAGFPGMPGARAAPNPYDPNTWAAMMQAAATMGINPVAALAAASGNPAAAASFNPYAPFNAFNPAAMNLMAGGFGQSVMAGFGVQNPVSGGFSDPVAMGLNPMGGYGGLNPMLANAGFMGGVAADSVFDATAGGGLFDNSSGAVPAAAAEGAHQAAAGFAAPWGAATAAAPGMFLDPNMMATLYAGGFNAAPAAPAFTPAAAAAGNAGGLDPMMAAMAAAAGFDPNMLTAAEDPSTAAAAAAAARGGNMPAGANYDSLLHSAAAAASRADTTQGPAAAAAARHGQLSTASSSGANIDPAAAAAGSVSISASRTGSGNNDTTAAAAVGDMATPRETAAADGFGSGSSRPQPNSTGRPPVPVTAAPYGYGARGPGLAPLMAAPPAAAAAAAAAPPGTAAAAAEPGSPPPAAAVPAYPPASPAAPMLGPFGALFHPMSPGGPFMHPAYAAPVAMSPYGPVVPASPFRIMHDKKSGAVVPYVEMGGAVYFAPPSPMPPHAAGVLPAPGGFAHQSPHDSSSAAAAAADEVNADSVYSPAADVTDASKASVNSRIDSAGRQRAGSGGRSGGSSSNRPQSGHTPLRMAGAALKLLEDNPYLVQDAIGSEHQHRTSPTDKSQQPLQRSNSGGYASSRPYYNKGSGAVLRSPARRGPYGPGSPQRWQAKNTVTAGSGGSSSAVSDSAADRDVGDSSKGSMHRKVGSGSAAAAGAGTAVGDGNAAAAAAAAAPQFDADAITAALKLPGSSSSSNAQHDAFADSSRIDQTDGDGSSSSSFGSKSPSMTTLTAIPEDSSAAAAIDASISNRARPSRPSLPQLNAQDPIVSPGRITLASKVKAARLYSSGFAKAAAAAGGSSPTGAKE